MRPRGQRRAIRAGIGKQEGNGRRKNAGAIGMGEPFRLLARVALRLAERFLNRGQDIGKLARAAAETAGGGGCGVGPATGQVCRAARQGGGEEEKQRAKHDRQTAKAAPQPRSRLCRTGREIAILCHRSPA